VDPRQECPEIPHTGASSLFDNGPLGLLGGEETDGCAGGGHGWLSYPFLKEFAAAKTIPDNGRSQMIRVTIRNF
jgi:hypothetical protein